MNSNIYKILIVICLCALMVQVNAQSSKKATLTKDSIVTYTDETINVAYGTAKKQSITYSTSSVNQKDIKNNSVYLSGNALFGKLPGLAVLQRTSEPGADAPAFYLRGRSTTKGNSALFIVDGIERDINDVQLEDIESITLLKDASAAVIFGIRGANGVINVVTKRGKTGPLVINGKVEQGVLSPTRTPSFRSSADYVKLYNQALTNDGLSPLYTLDQIAGYESGDRYNYPDVNWRNEVTNKTASGTKANIDVSGGDKTATYYVSLGYFHQGGIYKNTDMNEGYSTNIGLDNVSFRSNLDLNVNKNWLFSLDLNGRVNQKNAPNSSTSSTWDMISKYPAHLFPVYVEEGVYGGTAVYPNNLVGYINSRGYRRTNNRVINSTLSTNYNFEDVVEGLTAGMRFSADNFYTNQEGYSKEFAVKELLGKDASGNPILSSAIGKNGNLETLSSSGYPLNDAQTKRNTFEGNLQYDPNIGQNHKLSNQLIYHQDRLVIGSESPYNYQFLSGRINYGYMNRYFVEVGASYSGTEAFPDGNRFGFFPAVSAAWDISQENFLKGIKSINYLKLRASAGIVGNADVGERFSDRRQYINFSEGYRFGSANANQTGLYPGVIANNSFTWETANKYDIGVDAKLFNTLDVSFTYFFEKRKDILISEANLVPGIFGADLPNINAGITNNHGFEAALSFTKQKADWGYRTGLNVSYSTNKVEYFPESAQPFDYLYKTGKRISQPFMLEAIGFFSSIADIQSSPEQTFGPVQPGDLKYKDQNGDGRIDNFDVIAIKNTTLPTWDLGFDLGFSFKNFDLNAFFQAQLGRDLYLGNEPLLFWPLANDGAKISTYPKQFWTVGNQATADYPRLSTQENKNNYRESSFWYVNGNFIRLRSVDLGYNLSSQLAKKVKMSSARIFVRGMNIFTADHLKYADPEVLAGYPVMKSYNLGLSVQF